MLFKVHFLLLILIYLLISCQQSGNKDEVFLKPNSTDSLIIKKLMIQSDENLLSINDPNNLFDKNLKEAEEIAIRSNQKRLLCEIYIIVGKRFRNHSIYSKSYEHLQKALDIAIQLNDNHLLSECYNQIGVVYRRTGENTLAMDMHLKAQQYAEAAKDTFNISVSLNGIGNVNLGLKRYNAAIEYFNTSMDISKKQNNILGQAINYNNIGEVYQKSGLLDKALECFFKSLEFNLKTNSKLGQSICYSSIGDVYNAKGNNEKALTYLHKALLINRETGDLIYLTGSLTRVGETYLNLYDYENALYYLVEGLKIAEQIGAKNQAADAADCLARLYEKQGKYKDALDYYKVKSTFIDSLIDEKNLYHISNIEAVYESEKQKQKIQELNQRNELQMNKIGQQKAMIIAIAFASLLMLLVLFLIVRQSQLRDKYKNLIHKQQLLRSQMNPHFIFNALSAIQVFILEHDIERSSRFLSDFAKLMRQVLRNSNYDYITIKEELDTLGYYIELQNLRFSIPFEFSVVVDDSFDQTTVMIPPMLTQPFIENSIEHGLRPFGGKGLITLRFLRFNDQMIIEVEDNGIGIGESENNKKSNKQHQSMALKIVEERLDAIKKDTGKNVQFSIVDKQEQDPNSKGTIVRIEIPVIEKTTLPITKHGNN
jgi:tetratricopeptide (TPR) repeat protein